MAQDDEPKQFDKNKLAVALTYDQEKSPAPILAAKGKGLMAEAIIALAKQNNIEIRQDSDLVTILAKLDINMPIPLEAYAAVAEILAYIYRTNDKSRRKPGAP